MKQKRAVAINDISCMGKCSLTVALPIISSLGIETLVVPTAILSAHTAFKDFTFCDLTSQIDSIRRHWLALGESFDCIYSGYLGSFEQIELVSRFVDSFKKDFTPVVIDPVMGDNGKLYPNFDTSFAKAMAKLCGKADIITPNLTEAAFLLGEEYIGNDYDEKYIKALLKRLSSLGCSKVLITGISYENDKLGVACYDSEKDEYTYCSSERVPHMFHGTGDVFASSFVAAFVKGRSFTEAAQIAADFTVDCMKATIDDKENHWYGVKFENCLADFACKYSK